MNQKEVYALFKILYPETSADLAGFMQRSGTIGVKSKKKKKWFFATPITDIAERHHNLRKNSEDRGVSFHLVNIRGLITQKHNKVEILNKFADMSKPRRIMAITETHLMKGQHMDTEALRHLEGYKMYRTDRDTEYDEDALSKFGGTMVLASPDLISKKVDEYCYSNGNCELTTVEFAELKKSILVMYRPSGDNFSLGSFSEVLQKVREYLTRLRAEKPEYGVKNI